MVCFFVNDTATTEIYTLSLHDALPISGKSVGLNCMILSLLYRLTPEQCKMILIDPKMLELSTYDDIPHLLAPVVTRSEEHTSELQSRQYLVCRLLLEKKKTTLSLRHSA